MTRHTRPRRLAVLCLVALVALGVTTVSALTSSGSREVSQDTGGVKGFAEPGDFTAAALAIGDVDGDGFGDVVVGSPFEDVKTKADACQVHVLYGSSTGIGNRDKVFHQAKASVAGDGAADDLFGAALAVGDFDNDGFDDVAIGVPGKDAGGHADAGSVVVLYGRALGLVGARSIELSQLTVGIGGSVGAQHRFGHSLAVGDFNGDGYDDLGVGVPGHATNGAARSGALSVVFGGGAGLSAEAAIWITQNVIAGEESAEPDDSFGWSLAVGDFNGDGFDDVAAGAPGETRGDGAVEAGVVHALNGDASGIVVTDQLFSGDTPGLKGRAEAEDKFGAALAAGDFDRDGYDELAVGVPGESRGSKLGSGQVQVLRGTGEGLSGTDSTLIRQAGKAIPGDPDAGDDFGFALAVGDFNNNGRDDLAVGVPGESIGSLLGAGQVHVLFGRSEGISKVRTEVWRPGFNGGTPQAHAGVGRALAVGDIDGDGRDDLVAGSPGRVVNSVAAAGSFLVMFG